MELEGNTSCKSWYQPLHVSFLFVQCSLKSACGHFPTSKCSVAFIFFCAVISVLRLRVDEFTIELVATINIWLFCYSRYAFFFFFCLQISGWGGNYSVIVLDIFQTGVISIRWRKWCTETGETITNRSDLRPPRLLLELCLPQTPVYNTRIPSPSRTHTSHPRLQHTHPIPVYNTHMPSPSTTHIPSPSTTHTCARIAHAHTYTPRHMQSLILCSFFLFLENWSNNSRYVCLIADLFPGNVVCADLKW